MVDKNDFLVCFVDGPSMFVKKVIVGTVITRSPSSSIASVALKDFKIAISLFERTAPQSQRAKIALVGLFVFF